MKFLERVDRIVRPIAVPNLTVIIIAGHVLLLVMSGGKPELLSRFMLTWEGLVAGELWRLVSFLFIPPSTNPIFLFFILYIFYLMGSSLERQWGVVRYNTFLWLGAILTVAAAGVTPDQPITGAFLEGTVFLAFATYNPNFTLRLFFVLPIEIKWLAWLQAIGYSFALLFGSMPVRLMVLASIGNYLIFFAPTMYQRVHHLHRRLQWDARQYNAGNRPRHTCASCGVDSNTHPKMDFRYCSKCEGQLAYCEDHLRDHEHRVAEHSQSLENESA